MDFLHLVTSSLTSFHKAIARVEERSYSNRIECDLDYVPYANLSLPSFLMK